MHEFDQDQPPPLPVEGDMAKRWDESLRADARQHGLDPDMVRQARVDVARATMLASGASVVRQQYDELGDFAVEFSEQDHEEIKAGLVRLDDAVARAWRGRLSSDEFWAIERVFEKRPGALKRLEDLSKRRRARDLVGLGPSQDLLDRLQERDAGHIDELAVEHPPTPEKPSLRFTSERRSRRGHNYRMVHVNGAAPVEIPEGAALAFGKVKRGRSPQKDALTRLHEWLRAVSLPVDVSFIDCPSLPPA